ncbi:T9SS type A sorting domain-containing protein [Litoribaculum gwangyangense]|uniref:Secretion system C-terminal sorting domain-containing protein n=1 Tax=Litoribaculum gwangyangense TaxID=1130722 RepID=A0ABP9CS29_9FLAO
MKKNYLTFLLTVFCAVTAFAQITFNNNGGDFLWSNASNWVGGSIPTAINSVGTSVDGSLVDQDFTITGVQNFFGTTNNVSIGGTGVLTINPGVNNAFAIKNVSDSDVTLTFAGNVTINNSVGGQVLMRNENGNTNDQNNIEFANGSVLTLLTNLETRIGSGGDIFNFNGSLAGTAAFRVGASTTCDFGSTSNNSGFDGDFVFVGANGAIVVNTADNTTFLPSGHKFQVNQNNVSVQVNGANVIQGNFVVGGSNILTFDVNKNQASMGFISFPADGTLNIEVDNSVTELSFADSSAETWGTATVNISNFTEGVIRFGTDNAGLTSGQLAQINVNGGSDPVALDANGYLVLQSSLSASDFELEAQKRISYPTVVTEKLIFNKPQENVKVFDLTGKIILQNNSKNQTELALNSLRQGLYLVVFDNQKIEKFIKQ